MKQNQNGIARKCVSLISCFLSSHYFPLNEVSRKRMGVRPSFFMVYQNGFPDWSTKYTSKNY